MSQKLKYPAKTSYPLLKLFYSRASTQTGKPLRGLYLVPMEIHESQYPMIQHMIDSFVTVPFKKIKFPSPFFNINLEKKMLSMKRIPIYNLPKNQLIRGVQSHRPLTGASFDRVPLKRIKFPSPFINNITIKPKAHYGRPILTSLKAIHV